MATAHKIDIDTIAQKTQKLHYLVMDVASMIHRLDDEDVLARRILTELLMPAFTYDLDRTSRIGWLGSRKTETVVMKTGWVPWFIGGPPAIVFRDAGLRFVTSYHLCGTERAGVKPVKPLDNAFGSMDWILTLMGGANFSGTMKYELDGDVEKKTTAAILHKDSGAGQPWSGVPYVTMLLLRSSYYSPTAREEFKFFSALHDLKQECEDAGKKVLAKENQDEMVRQESLRAKDTTQKDVYLCIELPTRFEFDKTRLAPISKSSRIFIGEYMSISGSQKSIDEIIAYVSGWDFKQNELFPMVKKLDSAIREMQAIRQLFAGFFRLYEVKMLVAGV